MLAFLRSRRTPPPALCAAYDRLVREARRPDWYRDHGVGDHVDGRFSILATLLALAIERAERDPADAAGAALSASLTETFVADLDAQLRELGVGDPTLGKQMRSILGALAGRTAAWRAVREGGEEFGEVAMRGARLDPGVDPKGFIDELRRVAEVLDKTTMAELAEGRW